MPDAADSVVSDGLKDCLDFVRGQCLVFASNGGTRSTSFAAFHTSRPSRTSCSKTSDRVPIMRLHDRGLRLFRVCQVERFRVPVRRSPIGLSMSERFSFCTFRWPSSDRTGSSASSYPVLAVGVIPCAMRAMRRMRPRLSGLLRAHMFSECALSGAKTSRASSAPGLSVRANASRTKLATAYMGPTARTYISIPARASMAAVAGVASSQGDLRPVASAVTPTCSGSSPAASMLPSADGRRFYSVTVRYARVVSLMTGPARNGTPAWGIGGLRGTRTGVGVGGGAVLGVRSRSYLARR